MRENLKHIERLYARHGFELTEREEFDNYYVRAGQNKSTSAV
jgi:hypothetical protein